MKMLKVVLNDKETMYEDFGYLVAIYERLPFIKMVDVHYGIDGITVSFKTRFKVIGKRLVKVFNNQRGELLLY